MDYLNTFINELINLISLDGINTISTFLSGEDAVLATLFLDKTAINPQNLAKKLNITKGRISALIKSLTKKNYIIIKINTEDHRKVDIEMTKEGKNYFIAKSLKAQKYFSILFEKIGDEKTKELIDMLALINKEMKGVVV